MARKQNVVRMHHGLNLNIGIVIFVIIIIYVIFNLISYLTSSPVAEYEVGQGTIATNHVYHGLILRDETVVYAGQSGYINYYLKNGAKASVNDVVYSIDTSGELSRQISDADKSARSRNKRRDSSLYSRKSCNEIPLYR